jgi:hypothetical protein
MALVDGFLHGCRAIDLSSTGMVVERTASLAQRSAPSVTTLELHLRDGRRPIRVRARTVWTKGRFCAVRFVRMHDVDRLTIAEQLDRAVRRRQTLH